MMGFLAYALAGAVAVVVALAAAAIGRWVLQASSDEGGASDE
jgi:hypothetical protein